MKTIVGCWLASFNFTYICSRDVKSVVVHGVDRTERMQHIYVLHANVWKR